MNQCCIRRRFFSLAKSDVLEILRPVKLVRCSLWRSPPLFLITKPEGTLPVVLCSDTTTILAMLLPCKTPALFASHAPNAMQNVEQSTPFKIFVQFEPGKASLNIAWFIAYHSSHDLSHWSRP